MSQTLFHWDPKKLCERTDHWFVFLEESVVAVHEIVEQMESELPRQPEAWRNYSLVSWRHEFDGLERQLKSLVLEDIGVAVLKCGMQVTSEQARLLQLILGCRFGSNVTITAEHDDRPLFAIRANEDSTAGGLYSGNGMKTNQIGFHTDGSGSTDRDVEFLSMLCIRPAAVGGESRVANAQLAYELLPDRDRRTFQRLFPRQNPYHPNLSASQLRLVPVFQAGSGSQPYHVFSYHPGRIREGIQTAWGSIPAETEAAFCSLEKELAACSCEFKLCANDVLFLNNRIVAHDRRPFSDSPEPQYLRINCPGRPKL